MHLTRNLSCFSSRQKCLAREGESNELRETGETRKSNAFPIHAWEKCACTDRDTQEDPRVFSTALV